MQLIDTHCHLYSTEFTPDLDHILEKAREAGVRRFYLPAISSDTHAAMLALEARCPGECFAMMGLHPCYVKENYRAELELAASWLDQRSFVAIGEIGLDFYWSKTFAEQQYEAFLLQMQWALDRHLPIVIHTREAMDETIAAVKPFAQKGLRGIFHCFGGNYDVASQVIDLGFLLGIGGVITYKNAGLPAVLEKIGLEHLVLETDAPYLAPVPFRGKRNESSYLRYVAGKLAESKQCSIEEVAAVTTQNALKIFSGI